MSRKIDYINWVMPKKIAIICGDGLGGSILGQQCAYFARNKHDDVQVFYAADDAKFKPIKHLFPDTTQIPESYQQNNGYDNLDIRASFIKNYGLFDSVYFVVPDLLFSNPHAFDFKAYNTNPQLIREKRLLEVPSKDRRITIALSSSTPKYTHFDIPGIVRSIAQRFPNYQIYVPVITKWADLDIPKPDFKDLPSNVLLEHDPDFIESLDKMRTSEYAVVADNGISHIFYQWGTPRLLLDPQYQQVTHEARWRENVGESIPLNIWPNFIADVVDLNINKPYTQLVNRIVLLQNEQPDWDRVFAVKKF